jgi:hypothetical protein
VSAVVGVVAVAAAVQVAAVQVLGEPARMALGAPRRVAAATWVDVRLGWLKWVWLEHLKSLGSETWSVAQPVM